jgi:hypothetical protein
MIFLIFLILAILLIGIKVLLWLRPGKALKADEGTIVKILTTIQGVLDIVFPAVIAVFLYLNFTNGVVYIEAIEAILGIVISAAISIINIIVAITGGAKNGREAV